MLKAVKQQRRAPVLLLLLCFCSVVFPQGDKQRAAVSGTDEAALRSLTAQYFAAYAKEDLDGLMRLWSAKAPEATARKRALEERFALYDRLEAQNVVVGKITLEDGKARVRVAVEISAIESKTGQPAKGTGFGKMNRALQFVKEEGAWKVWNELSAEEELATALIDAKTEEARASLLSQTEPELVTVELRKALGVAGEQRRRRGDYAQALAGFNWMLKVAEQIKDQAGVAHALNGIGTVHYYQGDDAAAAEQYEKSLKLSEALDDKLMMARTYNNLGVLYSDQGNNRRALEFFQKSLALAESLGSKVGIATNLQNIGNLHRKQANYELALQYYRKALELEEGLKDKEGIAASLNNIGIAYSQQGDYTQALEYYQKSLTIKEELGRKDSIAGTLNNIGIAYSYLNNYEMALQYYKKSLTLDEESGSKKGAAMSLNTIALLYNRQRNYPLALEHARRSVALAEQTGNLDYLWQAHTTFGHAQLGLDQFDEAQKSFGEAINTIETLRAQTIGGEQEQQRFFENKLGPYHGMAALLTKQGKPGEAFAYAERAKARVLLDVLQTGRANIAKAMSAPEREREGRLKRELAALGAQVSRESLGQRPDQTRLTDLRAKLRNARLEYEAYQTTLYAAHPELKVRRGEAQPITLSETSQLLPDAGTALLEYMVTDEKTYLFVLTRGERAAEPVALKTYTVEIKGKELAQQVERFRQQLARRDLDYNEHARSLYDLLVAPARKELQGRKSLVIVPDGALWELPFQTLRPSDNRFLIEDHVIAYAPSLTVLREMMRSRRKGDATASAPTLLAFGNPALGKQTAGGERPGVRLMDEKLDPLPEAERLVNQLPQLYGAQQSRVYTGAEAREDRVKTEAASFRVLQLATHGVRNDLNPMYSYVLLSQTASQTEDGLLEAWEMMNLNLGADLVILSACETARGRVGAGEGMIGMTWALFVAGSPATVVSQWKVESASTTDLMLEFHRQLKEKYRNDNSHLTTAGALREAELKMLANSQYRHPFYWAGFVLIGDGR
ncbi:MAG: CHAT domain-containing tetratricopeptide repeat protein [Pyrinomonadaceae bacterium]